MELAESLYQRGFLSYPRTETDTFKEGTDLVGLIRLQTPDRQWGSYAQNLLDGAFLHPRDGGHDDGAHPPIHPTKPPDGLTGDDLRVYEFVARHFLACCSKDGQDGEEDGPHCEARARTTHGTKDREQARRLTLGLRCRFRCIFSLSLSLVSRVSP